ncbi:MAG: class I SAM-dependent methyltransferase, partial [bacterium]
MEEGEPVGRKEEYWSGFAYSYDKDMEYIVGRRFIQALAKILREERNLKEVIEFGCGTGLYTKAIAKNAKNVIATDLSNEMLEMARIQLRGFQNVTVQKADCYRTSFPSGRFDTVFMANLIHVIENPHDALRESHRILKDGGTVLIASATNYGARESDITRRATRYLEKFGMPPPYFRDKLSPDELASLVEG